MDNKFNAMNRIAKTIEQEFFDRYGEDKIKEVVTSVQKYKSIPITSPASENEVGLVLEEVLLVTKLKTMKNNEVIPVYELFSENGEKILETQDDGLMRFDKEIFDELIKDKIKAIEDAGFEVAGANTIDKEGKIESFFELINGKVTAINKSQRARIEESYDRRQIMDEISTETAESKKDVEKIDNKRQEQQNEKVKEQNEQQIQDKMSKDLGFSIFKMTKIDDPIFRMNNPQTRGKDIYAVLAQDGSLQFVTGTEGNYEIAEGFKDSGNASGRTTRVLNDEDTLEDNEINTYGEIYPTNRENVRYTLEIGQYGEIKPVEQIRYDGSKISETDKWISREVESSNTNYLDVNREGAENSNNITARTFNRSSTNADASKYGNSSGKGGISEVGKTFKENKPTRTNMESLAADVNQRYDEAKKMVVDAANKTGASLDPDTEAAVDKRVQEIVDNMNGPFTEDTAEAVLIEVKMQMADKSRDNSEQKIKEENIQKEELDQEKQEEGRNRLEEEFRRKMGKH